MSKITYINIAVYITSVIPRTLKHRKKAVLTHLAKVILTFKS